MPFVTPRPEDNRGDGGNDGPDEGSDVIIKDKNGNPLHFKIDFLGDETE